MNQRGRPGASRLGTPPEAEWRIADEPDISLVERLEASLHLPRPLCRLLVVRGFDDVDDAKRFLRPRFQDLHSPHDLADADRAAARIHQAIERSELILVHGDYDADGMCSSALVVRWIRELGGRVEGFLPHRARDGYDFGARGLERAQELGAGLVITTDCGIVAHETVARAGSVGIDVIVTDHHRPGETLPEAVAVVNPNRADCPYPNKGLCGTGVAYKVCEALGKRLGASPERLHVHLDLVALATVADLVPLTDENRVLVREGLKRFPATENSGLRALLSSSGTAPDAVDGGKLGWVLGPRLNAAGRMSDAATGLRLLLTDQPHEAAALADRLESENRARREEERHILESALERLEAEYDPERDFGVVLAEQGWHPGVIGIVASRIVERIHRPVVLVALDGEVGRGSGRSIPGFNLFESIRTCSEHLTRFGGHEQAAGMDLRTEDVGPFRSAFRKAAHAILEGIPPRPVHRADLLLDLEEASADVVRYLPYFGPFGIGNRKPVFLSRDIRIGSDAREVGQGHLKVTLESGGVRLEGIGFGMVERFPPRRIQGSRQDVLYQLQENEYRGRRTLQARLVDLRPVGSP